MKWHVIDKYGEKTGPHTREEIFQILLSGKMDSESLISSDSTDSRWKPVRDTEFAVGVKDNNSDSKEEKSEYLPKNAGESEENQSSAFIMFGIPIGALALLGGVYWVVENYNHEKNAKEQCLNLARQNMSMPHFREARRAEDLRILNVRRKDGNVVVEIAFDRTNSSNTMGVVYCLSNKNTIEIPSIFEQGRWR